MSDCKTSASRDVVSILIRLRERKNFPHFLRSKLTLETSNEKELNRYKSADDTFFFFSTLIQDCTFFVWPNLNKRKEKSFDPDAEALLFLTPINSKSRI